MRREDIIQSLSEMLLIPVFEFEKQAAIREFISAAELTSNDLSDLLIACSAHESGCTSTLTFDKKAARFKFFEHLGS